VFLIDQNDEKIGPTSTAEALRRAREAGLDLVEVAPTARPPVCKIMDYGKWRYQQQKKEDKSRASSRAGQLKELKFKTVKIGDHDLMIKVNHAREFLKEGNKVQFTLQFRGREMAHQDLGREIFRVEDRAGCEDGRPPDDDGPPAGPQESECGEAEPGGHGPDGRAAEHPGASGGSPGRRPDGAAGCPLSSGQARPILLPFPAPSKRRGCFIDPKDSPWPTSSSPARALRSGLA
jgi:translation initiation factor IF-3